ncbi:MAG: T9SS type A sorting domain-containing protein [Prevotellaceae bacterium]|nr:T9SS type A sorting domain-containing protein [Prevotellaceae bacterium]
MAKSILMIAAMSFSTVALADDDNIVVQTQTGNNAYGISDVRCISFGDNDVTVIKSDASGDTYAFDGIKKIYFEPIATGLVSTKKLSEEKLTVFIPKDGSYLSIGGWQDGKSADVDIFSVSGSKVISIKQWKGESVNISSLSHGVYVIKINNQTAKFKK